MGMMTRLAVSDKELELINKLIDTYLPETRVWAYGSRVKGTNSPVSDLDLVVFANKKQLLAVDDLREALEESPLPFTVDLHVWDRLPKAMQSEIEKDCVPLN
jgi:predicted nucleotidyltransferase